MDNESYGRRSCLFCQEETTTYLSSEIEIKEKEDTFVFNIQSWKVPSIVKEQLKPIFIVRKLLDIPEEKCAEYLQHNDNENGSETRCSWFAVCKSCDSTVEESYKVYRQIKRLESNLESLKVKLKSSILMVNGYSNDRRRRTRCDIGLGKARDFIHFDVRKFVAEENVHILADQELPRESSHRTLRLVNRKRKQGNRTSKDEIMVATDFLDLNWHIDSPVDGSHHTSDFDSEWQPISDQESDPLSCNVKDESDDYDSDYIPSQGIRKRKSRCKTTTKTRKKKIQDIFSNGDDTEPVAEDKNVSKPVRRMFVHRCKLCVAFFRSIKSFEKHEKLHSQMTGFPCPQCGWLFHTAKGLQSHLSQKHKTSTRKKRKQRKIKSKKFDYEVLEAIPYYCDHCHMIYRSQAYLLRHIHKYHNHSAYLACNSCDCAFPTKQLLELHCKEQHPASSLGTGADDVPVQEIKEEPQLCEHCSKSFSSKLKLDFHIATYHLDKLLTCKICGFKAGKYYRLLEHNRSKHNQQNTNDQRYMCEHCPKHFNGSSYLLGHMKAIHFDLLGINPLICKECNVTFHTPAALLEHENHVHKKIKGRCCEYCGKAFSRGCDLKRHILLHTAPREEQYKKGPFYCQFCQAKFNVRQALYYHLKRHHTDKFAHKCDYCGTGYVTQNTLLQHLRKCKAKKQTPVPPTQAPPLSAATIDVSVKQEGNNA